MELGLRGRVAIVTGASQGIGREIALGLAAEGASLVVCARRRQRLEATAGEIASSGGAVEPVTADVTDPGSSAALVDAALERFGDVDILVNNAGKGSPKPLLDQTDAEWRESFELNLLSAVRLARLCVPRMKEHRWGRIVNVSSRAAREPDPYFAPYAATKAGLVNFSKSLSDAFSGDGVLTNCVVPGLIRSEAIEEAAERSARATGGTRAEVIDEMLRRRPIPAGRIGEPADAAGLVVFLASERASWITGASFTVDGGISRSPL